MYQNEKGAVGTTPNIAKGIGENRNIPPQLQLSFTSPSPINKVKLGGQNKRLFEHLASGQSIHCFHPAKRQLKIGYLNARISDLVNQHGVIIHRRFITVPDVDGNPTTVKEYSLRPFQNHKA